MRSMPRDMRKYARQTNIRLILGGLLLMILIGEGLILVFYGRSAALSGLICMGLGLAPLILIWVTLWGLGKITERAFRQR